MATNYTYDPISSSIYSSNEVEMSQELQMDEKENGNAAQYTTEDTLILENVSSKIIERSFGRPEDYVEVEIQNELGDPIDYISRFDDYALVNVRNVTTGDISSNKSIKVNPKSILLSKGYTAGKYKIKLTLYRDKIFNLMGSSTSLPFVISSTILKEDCKDIPSGIGCKVLKNTS